jgi:type I restriction enzyme R subunit
MHGPPLLTQSDYFSAYRQLKLTRVAKGVLVVEFHNGVTWNTVRRNIFNWKHEQIGQLEAKVKSFCDIPHVLRLLKDFILFAEKEEELRKIILRQHQATAVDRVVDRALQPQRSRGLDHFRS